MWSPFVERLERALQLAAKIGFGNELRKDSLRALEDKIGRHREAPAARTFVFCGRLKKLWRRRQTFEVVEIWRPRDVQRPDGGKRLRFLGGRKRPLN